MPRILPHDHDELSRFVELTDRTFVWVVGVLNRGMWVEVEKVAFARRLRESEVKSIERYVCDSRIMANELWITPLGTG